MPRQRPLTAGTTGQLIKILVLSLVCGLAVWAALPLIRLEAWTPLAILAIVTGLLMYIYISPRRIAAKYLIPGTLLLIAFQVIPVLYTISTSFTNYGDGHRGTKEDAIAAIQASAVVEVPGSPQYALTPAWADGTDELTFLLTDADTGRYYAGDAAGLVELDASDVTASPAGKILAADGYRPLTTAELQRNSDAITALAVPTDDGGIRSKGLSAYEGKSLRSYEPQCDCVTDVETGQVWTADGERGYFVAEDGSILRQGWRVDVGLDNFTRIVTDDKIRGPFLSVLGWNILFAGGSVVFTFALGLACAMAMHHDRIRGKTVYRILMILPYAMPSFAMLLIWRDMFNQDYGLINQLLGSDIDWFSHTWTARAAVLLVNTWLGYPYMFLICTGALQALPKDTLEAASIDGASGFTAFRKITFPLLLVAVTPLLISSFAFNFNNFNAIRLTTAGHPFEDGSQVGATDLLITYTFRMAFGGTGADYGYASAVSVLIFVIVAVISGISFARTRKQEEVYR